MTYTAVLAAPGSRFDTLFDETFDGTETPSVPVAGYCLRRGRALLLLAVAVAQAWLFCGAHRLRQRMARRGPDAGMTTAEYAVGTVAACGFAALLYKVVTSGAVSSALQGLIRRALGAV